MVALKKLCKILNRRGMFWWNSHCLTYAVMCLLKSSLLNVFARRVHVFWTPWNDVCNGMLHMPSMCALGVLMGLQIIWIFLFFVIHNFSNNTNLRRNPIFIMLLCYTLHTWCFSNYTTDNMSPVASMTIPPTLCSTVYTASHAMLHSPFSSPCCLCYVLLPFLCHHSFLCCYL